MTLEELTAQLEGLLEHIKADGRSDDEMTDDESERMADLTEKINMMRARRSKVAEARSLTAPKRNDLHVNVAGAGDDRHERAFETLIRSGGRYGADELAEYRAQSEGTNSAGGYTVPTGFRNKLVERLKMFGGIAEAAEVITTSEGNSLPYPTIDDTANVGEIVAEGGTFAAGADLVFGQRSLSAYKYFSGGASNLPLKVSWELLQDSAVDIQGLIARKLGERIARIQAVHWATGTGSGQPQGLVTPITTSGTIGTLAYADLLATINFLDPAYWPNARWVFNSATLATIQGLVDSTGRPLVMGVNEGITGSGAATSQTLLGFPITIDQAMPSKATGAKYIAFGDIRQAYVIRRVKDVTLVVMNEVYAPNGQTGFFAWARADGAVQDVNAVVVRTGA